MASAREVLERLRAWLVEQSPAILRRDVAELIDRELAALPEEPAEQPAPRDWPEDASDENGRYECICALCGSRFVGHKRRVACRVCASAPSDGALAEAILCSESWEPETVCQTPIDCASMRSLALPADDQRLPSIRTDGPFTPSPFWTEERVRQFNESGATPPADDRDATSDALTSIVRECFGPAVSVTDPTRAATAVVDLIRLLRNDPDDRDATIAELREKVAGLQSQVDGMADDYQNCAKACSDEEMRAEKAEATIADLREKLEAAVHEVKRADDKIGAMEYHGNSVHHWWAKARAYYGAYDARDAAVARAEKAEARVAEMEAKAKPEPSWDERLGPWALRDYLECYKPFDRTPIESAVAELCRRALREEADRG